MSRYAPDLIGDFSLRFPGHHLDSETGLHYNRFRYYSPELGRYLQPDPVDLVGGLGLYAYSFQPLTDVDLDGLCPEKTPPLDRTKRRKNVRCIAARIRNELDQTPNAAGYTMHDNVTYAVMVVQMADGSQRIVVTSNGNRQSIHPELHGVVNGDRYVVPENNPPGVTYTGRDGEPTFERAHAAQHLRDAVGQRKLREHHAGRESGPQPSERVASIQAISPTRPAAPAASKRLPTGAIRT